QELRIAGPFTKHLQLTRLDDVFAVLELDHVTRLEVRRRLRIETVDLDDGEARGLFEHTAADIEEPSESQMDLLGLEEVAHRDVAHHADLASVERDVRRMREVVGDGRCDDHDEVDGRSRDQSLARRREASASTGSSCHDRYPQERSTYCECRRFFPLAI